jgi:hypothetical protein
MMNILMTYGYLLLVLVAIFFLPGATLLVLSNVWSHWLGWQRYLVAIGLSIAFYPVLFYSMRSLLPQVAWGPWIMGGLLLAMLAVTLVGVWRTRLFPLRLTTLEWVAIVILGLSFASRLWFVSVYSFPAWSDSLHHTLLTQLVAEHGRLPLSLEPYFPNQLDMYHLGLYSLSGTVVMLAQVPAHTALLWTVQFLNALCGVGVYLVLDRYVSRTGAVVGLAVVSLFSAHPALWVNWGRFTQLSSLVLLLFVWLFTLESLQFMTMLEKRSRLLTFWLSTFAALTTAGLFFLHFRVAFFYLLLLVPSLLFVFWQAHGASVVWRTLKRLLAIGLASFILVLPVLWAAANAYVSNRSGGGATISAEQAQQFRQNYYEFPLSTVPYLVAPVWLLIVGATAVVFGLLQRHWLTVVTLIWVVGLLILGNLYLLNISILSVTNLGAILIMLYLPLGLLIGSGIEVLRSWLPSTHREWIVRGALAFLLLASVPAAYARATTVELYRHFVTPADLEAMRWIDDNVPDDALFAINTYLWLPTFAHGTDAGYWIPYFTGNHIVTSSMLSDGLTPEYAQTVWQRTQAMEALKTDLNAVEDLYDLGVTHIYIGARGNFADAGLQKDFLLTSPQVELLFANENTAVLRIKRNRN